MKIKSTLTAGLALAFITAAHAAEDRTIVVPPGLKVTMVGSAVSETPVTYTWFKTSNAVFFSTEQVVVIPAFTAADADTYFMVAKNGGGETTSNRITLTLEKPPTAPEIKVQIGDRVVQKHDPVTLRIVATGVSQYRWEHDGRPIEGATGPSYSIAKAVPPSAGRYTAIASNAAGAARSTGTLFITQRPGYKLW